MLFRLIIKIFLLINKMIKLQITPDPVDKIDVEELIKEFKVLTIDTFLAYLKEVWRVKEILNTFRI